LGVDLLGSVPLQPRLAELADAGQPILVAEPESPAAAELQAVADQLQRKTAGRAVALPILRG
jgi:ATP-binding protein involved in chromosome partitioning